MQLEKKVSECSTFNGDENWTFIKAVWTAAKLKVYDLIKVTVAGVSVNFDLLLKAIFWWDYLR